MAGFPDMTESSSAETPEQILADGFARRLVGWAQTRNPGFDGQQALNEAAKQASLATVEGHVCADLSDWSTASIEKLLASGLVARSDDQKVLPLILDEDRRLYLHRYFDYEQRLARRLLQMSKEMTPLDEVTDAAHEQLKRLFGESDETATVDWQKIAAASALLGRLTIISGGPGTGKTTTVVKLLACLLAEQPDCRITLAAPTGKAAARLVEALREQIGKLKKEGQLSDEIAEQLPQRASTLHRLLEVLPTGGFRHHAGNPLPVDVLVVDEASMLDLALATRLIEAIPPNARLILLGDKDQLAAVEAGAVFSEIASRRCLSAERTQALAELTRTPALAIPAEASAAQSPIGNSVVWFSRNFRFNEAPGIGELSRMVNAGDAAAALAWLNSENIPNVKWIADGGDRLAPSLTEALLSGYGGYLEALPECVPDEDQLFAIFRAFNHFRVLVAVRESMLGLHAINHLLAAGFRDRLDHPLDGNPASDWYPGRPVMVLRNDYTTRLFNGDIGIALPFTAQGDLKVFFPDGQTGFRAIPLVRLPEHDTAFALTVHKSQGSEFEHVALILPARTSRVVTRELLYTGITRARKNVLLVSSADVLAAGIKTPTQRRSGMLARL